MKQEEKYVGCPAHYEVPSVDVIEIDVEQGFALSGNANEDYDVNTDVEWD